MGFRDSLSDLSEPRRSIALATHLGTLLENETCSPTLQIPIARQKAEDRYKIYTKVREPIAGYNCFGHVFASRRTALYKPNVAQILAEDGYAEIHKDENIRTGDVVVYSDEDGPTHVAIVIREHNLITIVGAQNKSQWVVISKFDDVSGEYEHGIDDQKWSQWPVKRMVYRPRATQPRQEI